LPEHAVNTKSRTLAPTTRADRPLVRNGRAIPRLANGVI
jgi:hypothetical protein